MGWKVSPQNVGLDDDTADSDADPTDGFTACVDLGVNDENLTLDAGFFKPASLGDFVWDDDSVNRNDVQDPGENGLPGVLVTLEDCFGKVITTDVDGNPISPITTGRDRFLRVRQPASGRIQGALRAAGRLHASSRRRRATMTPSTVMRCCRAMVPA